MMFFHRLVVNLGISLAVKEFFNFLDITENGFSILFRFTGQEESPFLVTQTFIFFRIFMGSLPTKIRKIHTSLEESSQKQRGYKPSSFSISSVVPNFIPTVTVLLLFEGAVV